MKKQLLIVSGGMEIGGIERSLFGLLGEIDYDRYDVDLLLFRVGGELLPLIDRRCNILPEIKQCAAMTLPIASAIKATPVIGIKRAVNRIISTKKYGSSDAATFALLSSYWRSCVSSMPAQKKKYDVAISFMWPHDYAAKNVIADKKIAWIHTDYTVAKMDFAKDEKAWRSFDKIAGVSDEVCEAFKKVYPSLSDRIVTIENILSAEFVKSQAEKEKPEGIDPDVPAILSVGRFTASKAFDLAAESCRIMKEKGCKFKWYLIGFGPDEELIRSKIKENRVEDTMIILGKKNNPYPYMAACDVYAQPSRYEGKAVTVREAQMLGKPVIITDFETAKGHVEDGVDGVICPMGTVSVADALIALLGDKGKQEALSKTCLSRDYSNAQSVNVLYDFIEN